MKRKLQAGLAGVLLLQILSAGTYAAAATFRDVPETHWACTYVEQAYREGAVNGRSFDGTDRLYDPDGKLNLAEWLAMCTRTCWPEEVAQQPPGEAWYSANLAVAQAHGLLAGLETVNVTAPLCRYDMAVATGNAAAAAGAAAPAADERTEAERHTADWDRVPERYREATAYVVAGGIISGVDEQGTFAGEDTFTRAQAAAVYCRLRQAVESGRQDSPELTGGQFDPSALTSAQGYEGDPCVTVHQNVPYFFETDLTEQSFETYGALDDLGRCTAACASIGPELMPTEERGPIGMVRPTGWHTVTYDCIADRYLYNRCHLIGYQLSGENSNENNLITGTRYLNVESMLPFENFVADYVKETGNHVLYRVTPVFRDRNLLADGVLMEGYSVEDRGAAVCFCVFAYNIQPGVTLDYATGDSFANGSVTTPEPDPVLPDSGTDIPTDLPGGVDYVLNTNTKKFHDPDCSQVRRISPQNRHDYTGSSEDLILHGYSPCGVCRPG